MIPTPRHDVTVIFDALMGAYGPRSWWPADTPFEVCVGAILTQNTSWSNVERAIANLKLEKMLTAESLRCIPEDQLASLIKPSGCYNVKSRRLKYFISFLHESYQGSLNRMFATPWQVLREELLAVAGIGRETADSILLYAGGQPTFVVDTYTKRLFGRLGLTAVDAEYETLRSFFMSHLPPDETLYNEYHALIVEHGKQHCRNKPFCNGCPLSSLCQFVVSDEQRQCHADTY